MFVVELAQIISTFKHRKGSDMSTERIKCELAELVGKKQMEHWFNSLLMEEADVTMGIITLSVATTFLASHINKLYMEEVSSACKSAMVSHVDTVVVLPRPIVKPRDKKCISSRNHETKKDIKVSPKNIVKTVGIFYGISLIDLESCKRSSNIAWARQVAMYLTYQFARKQNFSRVGRQFNVDHSTVWHAVSKIKKAMAKEEVKQDISDLIDLFEVCPSDVFSWTRLG